MSRITLESLLEAGCHFGHITRRWNPKMKPYIFMERNGIHIIDLKRTQEMIEETCNAIANIVAEGKKPLFVGTKPQIRDTVRQEAERCGAFHVTERWLGGMLTNFVTIRKSVKRLTNLEKMETDGTFDKLTKKERLFIQREREKLQKVLSGVVEMSRLPGFVYIVDVKKEAIAVKEANRLGIPIVAIVDTNTDPEPIDYPIPANDDAIKSVQLITKLITDAVVEGEQRASEKRQAEEEKLAEQEVAENESVKE